MVLPGAELPECHALQDAAPDAEPHQAEVLIVHFVLAVVAQAS
ncbi:molecular chaperone Tir [Escherichia coli]|nr:molecular chaperone Tir [Escherichia coli]